MIPFAIGHEYPRTELIRFVGSRQPMSGVIWGPKEPGCLVVTSGGRHAARAGYSDKEQDDGSWVYFGQGEVGDHDPARYANRVLIEADKTVLLFTTRESTATERSARGNYTKRYKFVGAYQVGCHEDFVPDSGPRKGNRLLKFVLVPVLEPNGAGEPAQGGAQDLRALRRQLVAQSPATPKAFSISAYRITSDRVRCYAIVRAEGNCEGCGRPAPFLNGLGQPFLEVHHIHRLADDGPDVPQNVAALCPNCHRKAHFSSEKADFHQLLVEKISGIEAVLARAN